MIFPLVRSFEETVSASPALRCSWGTTRMSPSDGAGRFCFASLFLNYCCILTGWSTVLPNGWQTKLLSLDSTTHIVLRLHQPTSRDPYWHVWSGCMYFWAAFFQYFLSGVLMQHCCDQYPMLMLVLFSGAQRKCGSIDLTRQIGTRQLQSCWICVPCAYVGC